MGRDTGHLRVLSPGIFNEQLFIEKLFSDCLRHRAMQARHGPGVH